MFHGKLNKILNCRIPTSLTYWLKISGKKLNPILKNTTRLHKIPSFQPWGRDFQGLIGPSKIKQCN